MAARRQMALLGTFVPVLLAGCAKPPESPLVTALSAPTDVFQRQADGGWLIVNEHVSMAPGG